MREWISVEEYERRKRQKVREVARCLQDRLDTEGSNQRSKYTKVCKPWSDEDEQQEERGKSYVPDF